MQRLRLTEHFAIEFGDIVAHPMYSGNDPNKRAKSAPIHIVEANDDIYLLNADGSATNNVREISALAKNVTYQVFTTRTPQCYTDVIMPTFDMSLFMTDSDDSAQYIACKLYAIAGFKWPSNVAALWLQLSMNINGKKVILRNLALLKTQSEQYQFKPIASKSVVLDNEQFTNAIEFDILDMSYLCTVQTDTIKQLRNQMFGNEAPIATSANIDVSVGYVYSDDVYAFSAPLYGQTQLWSFNEFALRGIKRVPLLSGDSNNGLYVKLQFVQGSDISNAYIEMSMNHRTMQLETFISQQEAIDAVAIQYDIIVQSYNANGEVIESASSHHTLQNASNALLPIQYIPIIKDSTNVDLKPEMCMIYVTAILTMQNAMGDIRFSRTTQLILDKAQITSMCWLTRPNVQFTTHDIIHKVVNNKVKYESNITQYKDRTLQIKVPNYIHISKVVVNDTMVATLFEHTIPCAKNATVNVSLQLIDSEQNAVNFDSTMTFVAKSSKNVIKDALKRSSNMLEFALSNNEGNETVYDIMTSDGKQIQRIILQA